jgi:hypothetical protein
MYPRTITNYFASIFPLVNQEIKRDLSLLNSQQLFGSDEAYSNDKVSQGLLYQSSTSFIIYTTILNCIQNGSTAFRNDRKFCLLALAFLLRLKRHIEAMKDDDSNSIIQGSS